MLRPDHDHPARLQLQKKAAAAWKGIVPGLHRQCIYGGLYYCCSGPCFVKSRMMCDSAYKSTVDCFVQTLKNDGPLAFYEGFLPNFARLGSWNVIMFLTLEQLYSPKGVCEEAWELEE